MRKKITGPFAILFLFGYYYLRIPLCAGAIWETEEAYIIDDLPENESLPSSTESSNACVTSGGSKGQCVPVSDCSPFYSFFTGQDRQRYVLEGLQRYLNGTEGESCTPNVLTNATSYVCCTTLKFANPRKISFADYLAAIPNTTGSNEITPELPVATAGSETDPKIVEGMIASQGEFPFAVAIIYNGRQMCGGSLIDSKWVVSAAHCFAGFNSQTAKRLVIKAGAHDITRSGEDHLVDKLFLHPGFFRIKDYFRDDVALIKLKTPVSASGVIKSVSLHTGSPSIDGGLVEAVVCGWGKTCAAQGCPQSSVLRKTKLPLVSNARCQQRYQGTAAPPITGKMICAGGTSGMDSCNGDSGGPLVIYNRGQIHQIGIVSWGIGCGSHPGVCAKKPLFQYSSVKFRKLDI